MRLDNLNVHQLSATLRGLSQDGSEFRQDLHGILLILLTKVNGKYPWMEFTQKTISRHRTYSRFPDYLKDWSKLNMDDFRDLFHADMQILNLLDEVEQRSHGGDRSKIDNVQLDDTPTGNSKEAGLRRLRKDRPDLHERVLEGEVSINKAMVEAGFRKAQVTCSKSADDTAARIRLLLGDEYAEELKMSL